jgi:hypothetical protein
MTATPNFAPGARGADAVDALAPAGGTGPFVLNLCSSTTPMALAQTDLPELKRFNFFVSRRFEEGRERFRLHMGYFATLAEAEEWLSVVREIYPGAWAGEAPGRKLRERAAAEQVAQAQHAAGPPAPRAAPVPAEPGPPESLALRVPVLKAAAPAAPAPAPAKPAAPKAAAPAKPAPSAKPAPVAKAAVAKPAPPKPAAAKAAAPARPAPAPLAPPPKAAEPARTSAAAVARSLLNAAPAPVRGTVSAPKGTIAGETTQTRGVFADSNVREVLKALGDASATGETRLMRAPVPPAVAAPAVAAREPAPAAREPTPPAPATDISDTQVLRLLETRRAEGSESVEPSQAQEPAHGAIPMLKPDDTGTREALKSAITSNAPVLFAVQLQWSVQAVELDKVPPLAIFSAYTLYTVEGSRDGRKWFGLRLGFFSDAHSAKQVAHYVRSEFTSVAVVPVSSQEKSRATDQDRQAATVGVPANVRAEPVDEFKLIDDEPARDEVAKLASKAPAPAVAPRPSAPAAPELTDAKGRKIPGRPVPRVAVGRAVTQSPPAPAARPARPGGKVGAREKRGPQSLEETLEILGASQLSIDAGSGETLNDTGVRHLRVEVQKNSPFSKLLERLSERMKKP